MSNKKYIEFIKAQVDDLKNIGFLSGESFYPKRKVKL